MLDVSINMISLFAFIVVLGIVVDDAIIVGESIYTWQRKLRDGERGAIEGVSKVGTPVIFAILTTIAAFWPILNVPGNTGKIMRVIPLVVIPCLIFSLVESLLVLPSHLSHRREHDDRAAASERSWNPFVWVLRGWKTVQGAFERGLHFVIRRMYEPSLEFGLQWRYLTVAIGIVTLLLTAGLVGGGFIKFVFFPSIEADFISARVTMPLGTPASKTEEVIRYLESKADAMREEALEREGRDVYKNVVATIGDQPLRASQDRSSGGGGGFSGSHLGEVVVELLPSEERVVTSQELVNRWREISGPIPGTSELVFTSSLFSPGEAINIELTGRDLDALVAATEEVKAKLATYVGVFDIADSYQAGKQEIKLAAKPEAEAYGITLGTIGRQVRQAFFGEEAQRIQRGRDDLRVMVRYPEEKRTSLDDLSSMRIRTPDGGEVPFSTVAEARIGQGYASIKRVDRRRAINVTADVDLTEGNPNEIIASLESEFLPSLEASYPGITYAFEGQGREQRETVGGLVRGFVFAIFLMYVLMAIPFKSYVQPIIIMLAIPFGLVGAVWGHVILGMDLTILSFFGIVALSGVVVNDSLVLVDFINQARRQGVPLFRAVREAGVARFRPILLTSATTFAGLTPLLLERSVQAQFLIPMATSLAFGVVFSTFISLVLVPSGYLIYEDGRRLLGWLYGGADELVTVEDTMDHDHASEDEHTELPAARSGQPPVGGAQPQAG
jgi:multidrug efflux pump subunit AcrB